jgi:predicted KAP-like P-loop ATPase
MITSEMRQQIHKLVDEANENELNTLMEVLMPNKSRYTQEEINSFYNRISSFEQSGSNGNSVEKAHANIRRNYNQKYGS